MVLVGASGGHLSRQRATYQALGLLKSHLDPGLRLSKKAGIADFISKDASPLLPPL
jgi:hypothetical protein